jgi:N-acetylglucosaminylphosphatidylinositol deacetylase
VDTATIEPMRFPEEEEKDIPPADPSITLHVLVIAHPDDESLFFLPWLVHTTRCHVVWLLCLTTGDYDGRGAERRLELSHAATAVLGVSRVLIGDECFFDHPTRRWDVARGADRLQQVLAAALAEGNTTTIDVLHLVTFDAGGVSGHVNHCDTFRVVQRVLCQQHEISARAEASHPRDPPRLARVVTAWSLETIRNPLVKYIPLLEWWLLLLHWLGGRGPSSTMDASTPETKTYRLLQPTLNWRAMATHRSQFVWYRRLFVVFSRYTYYNRLRRLRPMDHVDRDDRVHQKEL